MAVFSIIGIMLLSLYLYLAPCLNEPMVNQILFYPHKLEAHADEMITIDGIEAKEVFFLSGKHKINALFYRVPGSKDVVLINHGNAGNIDHRFGKTKIILDNGMSVLAYDYRGYGKSGGHHQSRAS